MYTEFWFCGILIGIAVTLILRVRSICVESISSLNSTKLSEGVLSICETEVGGMEQARLDAP